MNVQRPLSVLVVDDDPEIRELLAQFFRLYGFEAAVSPNAAEGLARAISNHSDVIVTDINMPRDSGIALLEKVKKYRPNTKVFIITGEYGMESDPTIRELAAGMFFKPFRPETLVYQVLSALKAGTSQVPSGG